MLSGMKIIGSVCDQTQTNASAVNFLINPNLQRGNESKNIVIKHEKIILSKFIEYGKKCIYSFNVFYYKIYKFAV